MTYKKILCPLTLIIMIFLQKVVVKKMCTE